MKKEFQASLQYLLMGAHFAQDSVNLGGLSEMFFEHAAEERQHGVKFMQYLRWRGDKDNEFLGRQVNETLREPWHDRLRESSQHQQYKVSRNQEQASWRVDWEIWERAIP